MTGGTLINFALLILGAVAVLAAFFFMLRALSQRSESARAPYDVGRQEARQSMQIDLVRSLGVLFVGIVLLVVFGFMYGRLPEETETVAPGPADTAVPTPSTAPITETLPAAVAPTETETAVPAPTEAVEAAPTNTPSAPTAQPTVTATPTIAPTPSPPTATVSSGVGVWLRSTPSTTGEQLAWLLDGTEVVLLAGRETADAFEWREVQAPDGQVGWVAAVFLQLPESSE